MEFLQTYETTVRDQTGTISLTVLTIPSRAFLKVAPAGLTSAQAAQQLFDGDYQPGTQDIPSLVAEMLFDSGDASVMNLEDNQIFANYVANAPIIPFEQSPLSTESLTGIALKTSKAGTVSVGSTVGFLSAAGHPGFLLITVPMGIVLCGASISFAKWLEENRAIIWNRLLGQANRQVRTSAKTAIKSFTRKKNKTEEQRLRLKH